MVRPPAAANPSRRPWPPTPRPRRHRRPATRPRGRAGTSPLGVCRPHPRSGAARSSPGGISIKKRRASSAYRRWQSANGPGIHLRLRLPHALRPLPRAGRRRPAPPGIHQPGTAGIGIGVPSRRKGSLAMTAGRPSSPRTTTENAPPGSRPSSTATTSSSPACAGPASTLGVNARIRGRAPCGTAGRRRPRRRPTRLLAVGRRRCSGGCRGRRDATGRELGRRGGGHRTVRPRVSGIRGAGGRRPGRRQDLVGLLTRADQLVLLTGDAPRISPVSLRSSCSPCARGLRPACRASAPSCGFVAGQAGTLAEEGAGGEIHAEEDDGGGHDRPQETPGVPDQDRPDSPAAVGRLGSAGSMRGTAFCGSARAMPGLSDSCPTVPAVAQGKLADSPRSSSILRSWLYLATRSERAGAPALICPALTATARSAIVVSSVSPERCEITVAYEAPLARATVSSVSVSVPIWLSLTKMALATPSRMPRSRIPALVTKMSSPTSCTRSPNAFVQAAQPSQSSSAMPSFDRHDRIAVGQLDPVVDHLRRAERPPLPGQHVGPVVPQLAGGRVERQRDLLPWQSACPLDRFQQQF